MTAAEDLDIAIIGFEGSAGDFGSVAIWVSRTRAGVSGQSIVAGAVAGIVTAGGCSMTVPAGRRSSRSCTLAVRMAPSIADFHRSSDAPGDHGRTRTRIHASDRRTVLWMA